MTSKSCAKSYRRKISNVTTASIQFDKLLHENSNRPTALKSAGTVGKWGITSFTSIRSARLSGSGDELLGTSTNKRFKSGTQNEDVFMYNQEPIVKTEVNKPKKFFKSRITTPTLIEEPRSEVKSKPPSRFTNTKVYKHQHRQSSNNQNKSSTSVETKAKSPPKDESKHSKIVLRICKGTAKIISMGDEQALDTKLERTSDPQPEGKSEFLPPLIAKDETTVNEVGDAICNPTTSSAENPEMRTTRSRAKKLTCLVNSIDNVSEISKISSPLKKYSYEVSNKHIMPPTKTENILETESPLEQCINAEPPIAIAATTTEELIEILSFDEETTEKSVIEKSEKKRRSLRIQNPLEPLANLKDDSENQSTSINTEFASKLDIQRGPNNFSADSKNTDTMEKIAEQDSSGQSDDNDSLNGNVPNEDILMASEKESLSSSSFNKKPSAVKHTINEVRVTKKGSIFKSRSTRNATENKRRALYKHKWSDHDQGKVNENVSNPTSTATSSGSSANIQETSSYLEPTEVSALTRVVTYPTIESDVLDDIDNIITSVKCGKNVKGFYTVVKNVKKAHQIQESGEFQEFNDDVEYILDTLKEDNPNATRCLSAISLASKCMAPAFRMHVRAHGTVAKFFKALQDSTKDQSLALCTATVMFVLSQDRLAMDLDRDCLELMLNLLESDASHKNALDTCGLSQAELSKNKEKVRQLCSDIQAQGHAKHINLDNITVGQLAMETLLSLTSKRAGEWFKEELRELGGLEHIIKTIKECQRHINCSLVDNSDWDEPLLDKLRKVDRCLRVLENVTHMNEENQDYLLKYDNSILISTLASLYHLCGKGVMSYPTFDTSDKTSAGAVLRECLFAIIKVLINLSHHSNAQSEGDKIIGSQEELINVSLKLILTVPSALPEEKRFDVMMLGLILLTNLIEQCDYNKIQLVNSIIPIGEWENPFYQQNGLKALIDLFYVQEDLAQEEEQKTDAILDGKKDEEQSETVSNSQKSHQEFVEETVAKLVQKAGRHMEHTMIAATVVQLIGNLIMGRYDYEELVRNHLRDANFDKMIDILQKYFNFMKMTASNEAIAYGIAATEKVIKFLKTADIKHAQETSDAASGISEDSVSVGHSIS